jgi:hypothetical protein
VSELTPEPMSTGPRPVSDPILAPDPTPSSNPTPAADTAKPTGPPPPSEAEIGTYRRAGRNLLWLVLALAALGAGLGYLTAGLSGMLGALIGTGIVALFALPTAWSMAHAASAGPTMVSALLFGSYVVKLAIIIFVLAALRNQTWFSRKALFVTVVCGAVAALIVFSRTVLKGRIPYVQR